MNEQRGSEGRLPKALGLLSSRRSVWSLCVLVLALISIALWSDRASAWLTYPTPTPCNKYMCTQVQYALNSGTIGIEQRRYNGSRGNGGYERWRTEWVADYVQNSAGTYLLTNPWGPTVWYTNQFYTFGTWFTLGSLKSYASHGVIVQYRYKFYGCSSSGCAYSYSDLLQHQINR